MSIMKKKKDDIAHAKEVARLAEIARIEAARKRKEQIIFCTRFRDELLPPNNVNRLNMHLLFDLSIYLFIYFV